MKKNILNTILVAMVTVSICIAGVVPVKAATTGVVITKATDDVPAVAVSTYSKVVSTYVPAEVRNAFYARGGAVSVFKTLDLKAMGIVPAGGWNSNISSANVGGMTMHNALGVSVPVIYINADLVDNRKCYKALSAERNICHEFGHFICGQASEIKTGVYNPEASADFANLYVLERLGYANTPKMLATLAGSFANLNNASEFYANVAAGLMLDPENTVAAFPQASAYVMGDINVIKGVH